MQSRSDQLDMKMLLDRLAGDAEMELYTRAAWIAVTGRPPDTKDSWLPSRRPSNWSTGCWPIPRIELAAESTGAALLAVSRPWSNLVGHYTRWPKFLGAHGASCRSLRSKFHGCNQVASRTRPQIAPCQKMTE